MIARKTLPAGLLALAAALALPAAARAATPEEAGDAGVARCLVSRLALGGQMFRLSDGTMTVVAIGRRGHVARWTIRSGAESPRIVHEAGPAGLGRGIAERCS